MRAGRKAAAAATAAAGLGLGISMVVVVVVVYLLSRIRQAALLVNLTQIVCNTSCSSEVFAGGQRREAARAGREEEEAAGWLGGNSGRWRSKCQQQWRPLNFQEVGVHWCEWVPMCVCAGCVPGLCVWVCLCVLGVCVCVLVVPGVSWSSWAKRRHFQRVARRRLQNSRQQTSQLEIKTTDKSVSNELYNLWNKLGKRHASFIGISPNFPAFN